MSRPPRPASEGFGGAPSIRVFESTQGMVAAAVDRFVSLARASVRLRTDGSGPRLALPTGRTFVPFYDQLARRYRSGGDACPDLSQACGFNLDELVLPPQHPRTFSAYMQRNVWQKTALEQNRFEIPKVGLAAAGDALGESDHDAVVNEVCEIYDSAIAHYLPLDIALLGVGADGHVGYNLPGKIHEATHFVELSESLAQELEVPLEWRPLRAVTVGFFPLRTANRILLLASGKSKAEAIRRLVVGPVDQSWPCTLLRDHAGLEIFADREASERLNET